VKGIESGFSIQLAFLTTGSLAQKDADFFHRNAVTHKDFPIHGRTVGCRIELEVLELADLVGLYLEHSKPTIPSPQATFVLEPKQFHEVESAGFRVIDFTIPAKQLVDVYDNYKHDIFRLNPRGPLVRSKINREISQSLESSTESHMFNILNNGISALCASWRRDGVNLTVRDFQIVNGCQTTVALHKARAIVRNDPKIMVDVKLVEGSSVMHTRIARATNTQNRLKYEDFVSTDPLQEHLQQEFQRLDQPWFYEIKRGQWAEWTDRREKERFREPSGKYRVLTVKDVAQAALAFIGKPGEAKDKPRQIFERKLASPDGLYDDVFSEGVTAWQLLLPSLIYESVIVAVKALDDIPDWLPYARLHCVWLLGEVIREKYGLQKNLLLSQERSKLLAQSRTVWFQRLFPIAQEAIGDTVQEATRTNKYRGPREFFRSGENYTLFEERLDVSLNRWANMARQMNIAEPLAVLP
jgi:hypothetical protein